MAVVPPRSERSERVKGRGIRRRHSNTVHFTQEEEGFCFHTLHFPDQGMCTYTLDFNVTVLPVQSRRFSFLGKDGFERRGSTRRS